MQQINEHTNLALGIFQNKDKLKEQMFISCNIHSLSKKFIGVKVGSGGLSP